MSELPIDSAEDHRSWRGRRFYLLCGGTIGALVSLPFALWLFYPSARDVLAWSLACALVLGVLSAILGDVMLEQFGRFLEWWLDD